MPFTSQQHATLLAFHAQFHRREKTIARNETNLSIFHFRSPLDSAWSIAMHQRLSKAWHTSRRRLLVRHHYARGGGEGRALLYALIVSGGNHIEAEKTAAPHSAFGVERSSATRSNQHNATMLVRESRASASLWDVSFSTATAALNCCCGFCDHNRAHSIIIVIFALLCTLGIYCLFIIVCSVSLSLDTALARNLSCWITDAKWTLSTRCFKCSRSIPTIWRN